MQNKLEIEHPKKSKIIEFFLPNIFISIIKAPKINPIISKQTE